MTPEAQRIAIAEACGWRWFKLQARHYRYMLHPEMENTPLPDVADMSEPICNILYLWSTGRIPDYLNDLNAMHEAENALTHDQLTDWETRLLNVLVRAGGPWRPVAHATAAQRAEAFLRTLSLWDDAK